MAPDTDTSKNAPLGHFEQIIITAIMTLGGESYGVPIYDEGSKLAERRINQGSLYTTLDRLEEKGLLSSWLSDPSKEPRGKPRRFYRLERAGLDALRDSLDSAKRLSEIFDGESGKIRRWI